VKKKVCEACSHPFANHEISVVHGALQWVCPPLERSDVEDQGDP
jgi:hypothetical protein